MNQAALANSEIAALLRRLPRDIAALAANVTVSLERQPSDAWIEDGIEPDTLGVFDGTPFNEEFSDSQPMPPRIILYLDNLWDFAEADVQTFRDEVRLTFLHELGHYLGWDEDELEARGLE